MLRPCTILAVFLKIVRSMSTHHSQCFARSVLRRVLWPDWTIPIGGLRTESSSIYSCSNVEPCDEPGFFRPCCWSRIANGVRKPETSLSGFSASFPPVSISCGMGVSFPLVCTNTCARVESANAHHAAWSCTLRKPASRLSFTAMSPVTSHTWTVRTLQLDLRDRECFALVWSVVRISWPSQQCLCQLHPQTATLHLKLDHGFDPGWLVWIQSCPASRSASPGVTV